MAFARAKPAPTPFALMGPAVAAMGYRPIPVMPNSKSPGTLNMGVWKEMPAWQEYRDTPPTEIQLHHWGLWDDANVGVILGNETTPGWEVGALDFDTDDQDILDCIESAVTPSAVMKRGRRGYTAFYQFPAGTKGRRFKQNGEVIFEILTGNGTRQTVLPPSIHPISGKPYEWITKATLADVPAGDLVKLSEDNLSRLIDTIESITGVDAQPKHAPFVGEGDEEGSPHRRLNTAALRNLGAWVPALGLSRLKATASGYSAIPSWRANGKGLGDDKRNLALGFSANGIKDFSADTPHSPLDVVMLAMGLGLEDAFEWLARKLGRWHGGADEWPELEAALAAANDDTPRADPEPDPEPEAEATTKSSPGSKPAGAAQRKRLITPTRFVPVDIANFPRRQWIYGRHMSRKYVSTTVAPGGVGKSSLTTIDAISLTLGRQLLDVQCHEGPLNCWYVNLEDPEEEIKRKVLAACVHYKLDQNRIAEGLFIDSGRSLESPFCIAQQGKDGVTIVVPLVEDLVHAIAEMKIDVLILDPFISTHSVNENDNSAIDRVAKLFGSIADRTNCAIELIHHVKKSQGVGGYTVDDGRGASSLLAAARSGRVLNQMTPEEAEKAGVANCRSFFRANYGKSNLSPGSDRPEWYQNVSVELGNRGEGDFDLSDDVGVVESWKWPAPPEPALDLHKTQMLIAVGGWREDPQTKLKWVGHPVAQAHGLDADNKTHHGKLKSMIAAWIADGSLVRADRRDENRKIKSFIEIGTPCVVNGVTPKMRVKEPEEA